MARSVALSLLFAAAASVACAACAVPEELVAVGGIPEDGAWIGAWLETGDGSFGPSTGLLRSNGRSTQVFFDRPRAGTLHVVVYSAAAISETAGAAGDGTMDPAALARDPLALAGDRDPVLPPPLFAGSATIEGVGDSVELSTAGAATPPLTAAWLPRCERWFGAESRLDVRCGACSGRAVQTDCSARLELASCPVPALTGSIDGRGVLRFEPNEMLAGCRATATATGADRSLLCAAADQRSERCAIDVYEPESAPGPLTVVRRRTLHDLPLVSNRVLRNARKAIGYLSSMVLRDDALMVGTVAGLVSYAWDCPRYPEAGDGQISLLDPRSLETTGTATTPPCLTHLLRDPHGRGAIGVFGRGSQELGRFDERGVLVDRRPIAGEGVAGRWVIEAAFSADDGVMGLLLADEALELPATFVAIDPRTLDVTLRRPLIPDLQVMTPAQGRRFIFFEEADIGRVELDADTGEMTAIGGLFAECGVRGGGIVAGSFDPVSRRTVLAARGLVPAVISMGATDPTDCAAGALFEAPYSPYSLMPWRARRGAVLVGAASLDTADEVAAIGVFDPARGRALPGLTTLGEGVVTQIIEAGDGRVYALLPAEPAVVLAEPAVGE